MTTAAPIIEETGIETIPRTLTGGGQSTGYGKCDGCPRCQDAKAGFCPRVHHEFGGQHPVCKVCGHCVLRGEHDDDADDLDDYANRMGPPPDRTPPSRN